MRKYVRTMLKQAVPRWVYDPYRLPSYAQEGEDRILARLFEGRRHGFYVDVGAHHPRRFSNTYLFYRRGWTGINIDPTPGSARLFTRARSRDINLEVGVTANVGEMKFFMYDEPAFNTFNEMSARQIEARGQPKLLGVKLIKTAPLRDILRTHCAPGCRIDFLSVDAEGLDLEVFQSNDWDAFRPRVLVGEDALDAQVVQDGALGQYLSRQGYRLCAKTLYSCLFIDGATLDLL